MYEGKRLTLSEMRRMGRKEWRKRFPGPTFFSTGKGKGYPEIFFLTPPLIGLIDQQISTKMCASSESWHDQWGESHQEEESKAL